MRLGAWEEGAHAPKGPHQTALVSFRTPVKTLAPSPPRETTFCEGCHSTPTHILGGSRSSPSAARPNTFSRLVLCSTRQPRRRSPIREISSKKCDLSAANPKKIARERASTEPARLRLATGHRYGSAVSLRAIACSGKRFVATPHYRRLSPCPHRHRHCKARRAVAHKARWHCEMQLCTGARNQLPFIGYIPTKTPRFRKSGAVGKGFRSSDRFHLSRVCS